MFLLLAVVFLLPVAVYLTILALLNRRLQPVMVSGTWDCIGLLFAGSGLLLVVGPAILSNWYQKFFEDALIERQADSEAAGFQTLWLLSWGLWILYYLLVFGAAALMFWGRRRRTVIYNIDPQVLDKLLVEVFDKRGFEVNRLGNRLFVGAGAVALSLSEKLPGGEPLRSAPRRPEQAMLDVEPFAALSNVTLHWHDDPGEIRTQVERDLAGALMQVRTFDNSSGTWLLGIAGLLFGLIFLAVLAVVLGTILAVRK